MEKKHGELKIMTAKEMADLFCENYKTFECDFASLDIERDEFKYIPIQYLDFEKVYDEAEGWCGIRTIRSPFDGDDQIIAIGDFGYGCETAFNFRDSEYDDYGLPIGSIYEGVARCLYIDWNCGDEDGYAKELDKVLVIVEVCDEAYKQAQEELKVHTILNEAKERMAI